MFKIKRTSNRNLTQKDTLTESQHNIPESLQAEKVFRRPPSAKLNRTKVTNHIENLQNCSEKSIEIRQEVRTAGERLTERSNLQQQIRNLCLGTLKDKCRRLGELREGIIKIVLQKAIKLGSQFECDDSQPLIELIENEADKVIKRNECKAKYESSLSRIQNMLEDRLNKLEKLR